MTSTTNEREISPMTMPLDQLNVVKTQQEEDILELNRQMETLLGARNRYINAKHSIAELAVSFNYLLNLWNPL